jgi:hypothetical protein
MEAAYRELLEAKQRAYLTFLGTLVAGARLETGQGERALQFLDEVQQLSAETQQLMFMPDLHRLRVEALRRLGAEHLGIDEGYRRALQLARARCPGAGVAGSNGACGLAQADGSSRAGA